MDPGLTDSAVKPPPSPAAQPEPGTPGFQESLLLIGDSLMTLLRLLKTETVVALSLLPALLVMNLVRLPMALLTWISFVLLLAFAMYSFTDSPLAGVATFFAIQLAATLLLERSVRVISKKCSLPETRKSMAMMVAAIHDRISDEQSEQDSPP